MVSINLRPLTWTLLIGWLITYASVLPAVTLNAIPEGGSTIFNGLLLEASDNPRTGVVLLHGRASHPDGPVVSELRTSLYQAGYTTLSIETASPSNGFLGFSHFIDDITFGNNIVFPETYARVRTAINHLESLGVERVFVIGFSMGSRLAAAHVARGQTDELPIIGLIGVGMYATSGIDPLDHRFTLDEVTVPVLDIHGDLDSNAVTTATARRSAYYSGVGPAYSHVVLPCNQEITVNDCHKLVGLKGNQTAPLESSVITWIKTVTAAIDTSQPFLGRALTLSGNLTDAVFLGGASRNNGTTFSATFSSIDSIDVLATIGLNANDIGSQGSIFVVAFYNDRPFYKDNSGTFKPWDGKLDTLEATDGPRPLAALENVDIVSGLKGLTGSFKIFIAYQDSDQDMHVNGTPIRFEVQP